MYYCCVSIFIEVEGGIKFSVIMICCYFGMYYCSVSIYFEGGIKRRAVLSSCIMFCGNRNFKLKINVIYVVDCEYICVLIVNILVFFV